MDSPNPGVSSAPLDPIANDLDDPALVAGVEVLPTEEERQRLLSVAQMVAGKAMVSGVNYLSDLDWVSAKSDYGPVERDQSVGSTRDNDGNKPLIINGASYTKGLGVHGDSEIVYSLNAQCMSFQVVVGINDYKGRFALGNRGSMIFQVATDGAVVHETTVITGNSPAQTISLSVSGVDELKLITRNNGVPGSSNDSNYDHGNWADAQVTCVGDQSAPPASTPNPTPTTPTPDPTPTPTPTPTPEPSPVPTPSTPPSAAVPTDPMWTECSVEFGFCRFTGTRRVRYGANGIWVIRELTAQNGGISCTNATFGGDPLPGVTKRCYLESGDTTPQPAPAPAITSFSATPGAITAGGSATLSWAVANATSLSINNGIGAVTGTSRVVTPAQTTTYTLTATNSTGSVTSAATVMVNPAVPAPTIASFSATPDTVTAGSSATLNWSVTNATSLNINNGVGTVTGTSRVVIPAQTTTYTLTAANATGNTTRTATVMVNPAPEPAPGDAASRPTPNNNTPTSWSYCSELYNGPGCSFDGMRQVRIGTGNKWVVKKVMHRLYSFECSHAFFGGNAAPGEKQHCEYANTREEGTLPTPNTCFNEANGCPTIDLSRIPLGDAGFSELRIKPETVQLQQTPDGGSFRTECKFSHMAFNDPIVYPNQPGRSHLHAFFGNTAADAFSTPQSVANTGNSTCAGGIANRTAYWIPALIDTRTGAPIVPDNTIWYYKTFTVPAYPLSKTQPLPSGLRMIAGDMHATGPQKMTGWGCFGRGGTDSASIPVICNKGEYVEMRVTFPSCWDGKNLDSADHKSHMSYSRGAEGCPASHPHPVPEIRLNVRYLVQNAEDPKFWRLSSDHLPRAPGLSAHADWFDGWIPSVRDTWVRNCSQRGQNCEVDILGDGTRLY